MDTNDTQEKAKKMKDAVIAYNDNLARLEKELSDTVSEYGDVIKKEKIEQVKDSLMKKHA